MLHATARDTRLRPERTDQQRSIAMRIDSHLKFAIACICLVLLAPGFSPAAEPDDPQDKTASPYFFIDGDPALDRLPLKSTDVDVHVAGVIADVKVTQHYKNEGGRALEARYVFPGSNRAAVYSMTMRIGQRLIEAQIREKNQARAEYETAKREGKTASLLEEHRPNVFQMNVANILPGDDITVEMRYTELLVPSEGQYRFVFPTVVGPRYNGSPASGSGVAERWPSAPFLHQNEPARSSFSLKAAITSAVPVQEIKCGSHKIDTHYENSNRVVVNVANTGRNENNRDFVLDYSLSGDKIESGVMLYKGKDENFFLAMLEPPAAVTPEDIPAREYVFIVDVSGSMYGFPLETAKKLLGNLVGTLRPKDSFNVLLFAGGNTVLSPASLPATRENIQRALQLIREQRGGGATELLPALKRALALPRDENRSRTIVVVTDGYVTIEKEAFELIRTHLGDANLFAFGVGTGVNRFLIEGMARAGSGESFVVNNERSAEQEAERFRRYIESPVLTRVKVSLDGFDAYDIEPESVPDVFASRPVIVFGKWRGEKSGVITVRGMTGAGPYSKVLDLSQVEPSADNAALRYLWARSRIATLSDYSKVEPGEGLVAEVTQLGLKYNLLTQYTSFIAVDKVIRNTNPDGTATVDQPSPLPEGVSDLAVGGEIPSTPEPQTWALLIVAMMVLLWLKRRGRLHV
jgi:Ca-activated chloride channel homolog